MGRVRHPLVLALPAFLPLFGTEAMFARAPDPTVWHHEGLTKSAAAESGFSAGAAANLATHADRIDQYLYSPVWKVAGGVRRVRAVRRRTAAWASLHFDDLSDLSAVDATWNRITGGAACALRWAATSEAPLEIRLRAAEHVLGLGIHAVQDLYSHSTWIDDPQRRALTWQEARSANLEIAGLSTGAYLHPGVHQHGGIQRGRLLGGKGPVGAAIPLRRRWHFPRGLATMGPGVNLDSRWQARAGVEVRGLDLGADEAFATAYELARRSSVQWLNGLREGLVEAGHGDFWTQLTRMPERSRREVTDDFEDPDFTPHLFLTVGAESRPQLLRIRPVAGEWVEIRRDGRPFIA